MKNKRSGLEKDGTKMDYNNSFRLLSFLFKFTDTNCKYGFVSE